MSEATATYQASTNGARPAFNPREHLRSIVRKQKQPDGSYKPVSTEYLDVKWRIMWFRTEHPNGSIVTELLSTPGEDPAVVRATVTTEDGTTTTGMGQQGASDWSDWLEKAETRAIGRALGAMGYGTQFCEDFDDSDSLADSPVEGPRPTMNLRKTADAVHNRPSGDVPDRSKMVGQPPTKAQLGKIHATRQQRGWSEDQMYQRAARINPEVMSGDKPSLKPLDKAQASELIEALLNEQPPVAGVVDTDSGEIIERPVSQEGLAKLQELAQRAEIDGPALADELDRQFGKRELEYLSADEARQFAAWLKSQAT